MTLQEIEDAIVAQAEKRRAEGWTIVMNSFGLSTKKTCCALSSFDYMPIDYAQSAFGWTEEQVWLFLNGFDMKPLLISKSDHYLLGVRVRERLGL
jgi:hypothetical protein